MLAWHRTVGDLLVGEYLRWSLIKAPAFAVSKPGQIAKSPVAGASRVADVVVELAIQSHARLVCRDPGLVSGSCRGHGSHAPAVLALALVLAALLLLARGRDAVLLHAHVALLLRLASVSSGSRPAIARPMRVRSTLLDALRQVVTPLLPLVFLISQLPLFRQRKHRLAVQLERHLVLVVSRRLWVLLEAAGEQGLLLIDNLT